MLKKLADLKLIDYVPYQGAQLTAAGEKIALEVIRHHRLIELYLIEAMGYTWDQVHAEADKLEHAISEEFEDTIARLLGDPQTDPHGDPIPSKSGTIAQTSRLALTSAEIGARLLVQRVRDEDPVILRRVAELDLVPRSQLTVCEVDVRSGAVTIERSDGRRQVIARDIAESIFVISA
jgi:DtxR family Mn-dependent transcriptional regulator